MPSLGHAIPRPCRAQAMPRPGHASPSAQTVAPDAILNRLGQCPTPMPNANAQRHCPTPMPNATAQRPCPTPLPNANAQRHCPTPMPNATAQRHCPTARARASHRSGCASPILGRYSFKGACVMHLTYFMELAAHVALPAAVRRRVGAFLALNAQRAWHNASTTQRQALAVCGSHPQGTMGPHSCALPSSHRPCCL
jgi:hypothetical protein